MDRKNWTKEELILAFNLYLKLPFGKMHKGNPRVIHLANILGRTPSSIAMRLTNFAAVDPFHQGRGVKGLPGGVKQCQPIWDEFINHTESLIFESERLLAEREQQSIETKYAANLRDIQHIKGEDKIREVKTRVNQCVFREVVMAVYSFRCAITGIDIPDLLVASHIRPWSQSSEERLNPENGICLSSLYDKAFDRGLIGIDQDYSVVLSKELKDKAKKEYYPSFFSPVEGLKINLPERFLPKREFLQYHFETIFKG